MGKLHVKGANVMRKKMPPPKKKMPPPKAVQAKAMLAPPTKGMSHAGSYFGGLKA